MRDWVEYVHSDSTSAEAQIKRATNMWSVQADNSRRAEDFELLLEGIAKPVSEIRPLQVCQIYRPVGSKHDMLSVSVIDDLIALVELNILVLSGVNRTTGC